MATKQAVTHIESHGDSNRCTPCRENLIHMTHTLLAPVHVCHSYTSNGGGGSPYVATFHADSIELDRFTALEKSAPDSTSQPDSVAYGTHLNFSPKHNH
jgi:hypothetical protein